MEKAGEAGHSGRGWGGLGPGARAGGKVTILFSLLQTWRQGGKAARRTDGVDGGGGGVRGAAGGGGGGGAVRVRAVLLVQPGVEVQPVRGARGGV